ncbi:hypothetical protein [Secundilactobacillus collinoides]|uniref:hypothetical protein n=1 Tax=Secundilactobacillus collinoides TaxID=33960 RepID=UPI000A7D450E|nr:hypothetical protein [Secundilactobacillus collinoides]
MDFVTALKENDIRVIKFGQIAFFSGEKCYPLQMNKLSLGSLAYRYGTVGLFIYGCSLSISKKGSEPSLKHEVMLIESAC